MSKLVGVTSDDEKSRMRDPVCYGAPAKIPLAVAAVVEVIMSFFCKTIFDGDYRHRNAHNFTIIILILAAIIVTIIFRREAAAAAATAAAKAGGGGMVVVRI